MLREYILVTNNPLVNKDFSGGEFEMVFDEKWSYLDVLLYCREKIHQGYILETHPLSGSIKPNETPFKTVMISRPKKADAKTDMDSLLIMEDAILTYHKFQKDRATYVWGGRSLEDFSVIDHSLIKNVLPKLF